MVDTLNQLYDEADLQLSLAYYPLEWHWKEEDDDYCSGWRLHCGRYIVAFIWNIGKLYQTWRTAWCGAHNVETDIEQAKRWCEAVVTRQKEKHAAH